MNRITGEMMDPVDGATQEIQGWANWRPLEVLLKDLRGRLQTLEQREPLQDSFAATIGTAERPLGLSMETPVALTENQVATLGPITLAIMACIKSTPSIPHEWGATWDGSSILLRISALPSKSGQIRDGYLGPVAPDTGGAEGEEYCVCGHEVGEHSFHKDSPYWMCDGAGCACPDFTPAPPEEPAVQSWAVDQQTDGWRVSNGMTGLGAFTSWAGAANCCAMLNARDGLPPHESQFHPPGEPAMQLHDFDPPLEAQSPSAHSLLGQSPFSDEMHPTGRDGTCPECYSKGYDDALEHDFNPPSVSGEVRQCDHPSHSRFHFAEQGRNGMSWWCIDCGALALGDYQKKVRLVGPTMQEHLG